MSKTGIIVNEPILSVLNKLKNGSLKLRYYHYSENESLSDSKKAELITVILNGLPTPEIFTIDIKKNRKLVVVMKKRIILDVIQEYVKNTITLKDVPSFNKISEKDKLSFYQYELCFREFGNISEKKFFYYFEDVPYISKHSGSETFHDQKEYKPGKKSHIETYSEAIASVIHKVGTDKLKTNFHLTDKHDNIIYDKIITSILRNRPLPLITLRKNYDNLKKIKHNLAVDNFKIVSAIYNYHLGYQKPRYIPPFKKLSDKQKIIFYEYKLWFRDMSGFSQEKINTCLKSQRILDDAV